MKRLLLAGTIAVAVHALFLISGSGRFAGRAYVPRKKLPITMSLNWVRQPAGRPVQDERMAVAAIRGPAVPARRTEAKPPPKPKPQPKPKPRPKPRPKLRPKPKPRPEPKPHPKKKPRHEPAARPEPAPLEAKAKPVSPPRAAVPEKNQEERKPEQALSVAPVPKKETSKPPSTRGFTGPVSDEMVQEALSDYPDQGAEAPQQGLPAAGAERGKPGSSGRTLRMATPLYLKNPRPKYPEVARRRRFQGTVLLEVLVKKDGRAGDVRISRSSGHPILDRAALTAVKKWIFTPGSENGRAAAMRVKIPIRFELD